MRSRYTAYTLGDVEYILGTHDPSRAEEADRENTTRWSRKAKWHGLEIRSTERGTATDEDGVVEFVAHYEMDGRRIAHHERSTFRKVNGTWFYLDGDMVKPMPVRLGPRAGRNDPCPCGSGKKYKKCCIDKVEKAP